MISQAGRKFAAKCVAVGIASDNVDKLLGETLFVVEDEVRIVSLMDHTPGQRQFRDLGALKTYVAKKRGMTDAEFVEHVANLKELQRLYGARGLAEGVYIKDPDGNLLEFMVYSGES